MYEYEKETWIVIFNGFLSWEASWACLVGMFKAHTENYGTILDVKTVIPWIIYLFTVRFH